MTLPETSAVAPATSPSDVATARARRRSPGPLFFVALALAVVLTSTLAIVAVENRLHQSAPGLLRVSGLPSSVPTSRAQLMGLSPVPPRAAPGFTLTDQNAHTLSFSSFRGRVVVLEFMDPHCVDICPLVSREFVDAYHDLGKSADKVIFMAVNVNRYFAGVASMATFSREHQLSTIPSWHFFTGPLAALSAVWRDYGITVEAPHPNGDIIHTSLVYFIDPSGHERYIAVPQANYTKAHKAFLPGSSLASWGRGIAEVAKSLS